MSSDFYFRKWIATLSRLQDIVHLDLEYQNTNMHYKTFCEAVTRLHGVLGQYIVVYNESLDCLQQNFQVQKTQYIAEVVEAITNRIIEIKHQISKLECSNVQFLSHGLVQHKLTANDAVLLNIPLHFTRPENINILISEAIGVAKERKEELQQIAIEKLIEPETEKCWCDDEANDGDYTETQEHCIQKEESEESVQKRKMASLLQAHERCRQVTQSCTHQRLKRIMWQKELEGTLKPQTCQNLQDRSAKLIQKVMRAYFDIKRRKKLQYRNDEILGMRLCNKSTKDAFHKSEQIKLHRIEQIRNIENEWRKSCEMLKEKYKIKTDQIREDYRDYIRNWFRKWFDEIQYFHDIPKKNMGGSVLIMKEELIEPRDWWEQYQEHLAGKKAINNSVCLSGKWEGMKSTKEERKKKKLETDRIKKLMKNPTVHPGFHYPKSKKTQQILNVIENYNHDWKSLDLEDERHVKERFVIDVDKNKIYSDIKMDLLNIVGEDMREEFKLLRKALKTDYFNNAEKMPKAIKKTNKQTKKKKKEKTKIINDNIFDQLQDLAFRGIVIQYPHIKLENFLGDHNYAGDDIRCKYQKARQFSGELRAVWWEQCWKVSHGFHQILIVGPRRSGKTVLVHALASLNEATLFVLNLDQIHDQTSSAADLQEVMTSVVACARAVQPSVIYIRHVHRLYYKKVPLNETITNMDEMKRILLIKLCKKIHKTDKITVIATCIDPWKTKSSKLLEKFPNVILIPDTSYSAVVQLLNHWVNDNHSVPRDLDVQSLAHILQGYSYGYLKEALADFLTPDRIVKIAAYGLSPQEVFDFILSNDSETKVDYEKYIKWYYNKTYWGKKEEKHLEEQIQYKKVLEKFNEKSKKKKQTSGVTSVKRMPNTVTGK